MRKLQYKDLKMTKRIVDKNKTMQNCKNVKSNTEKLQK